MVLKMSKTYQYRKIMKPLLERKRRARINKCLDHLKELMVECLTRDGEHVTRLEKADILELTVDHMRKLKQSGTLTKTSSSSSSSQTGSFRSGYFHAADQIIQALHQQLRNDELYNQIVDFLSKRFQDISGLTSSSDTKPSLEEYSPTFDDNFTNEYCIEYNNSTTTKAAYELPRNYKSMWRPW